MPDMFAIMPAGYTEATAKMLRKSVIFVGVLVCGGKN